MKYAGYVLLICISILISVSCKRHDDEPQVEPQSPVSKSDSHVTICHIPPGNPVSAQTMIISESALSSHLAHGDYEGACETESEEETTSESNPTGGYHPVVTGCGSNGFGANGTVTLTNMGNSHIYIRALILKADCSIVVGGPVGATDAESDFGIASISTSGTIAMTRTNVSIYDDGWDSLRGLVLSPTGKFTAFGYSHPGSALVRYLDQGTVDTSFQSSGILRSSSSIYSRLAYYNDGKFLSSNGSALTRYNADGSIDPSYGVNGTQSTIGNEIYILSNGKSLTGKATNGSGFCNLEVERRNYDGTLDSSFGTNGVGSVSLVTALTCGFSALSVGEDGKIFIGGYKGHTAIVGKLNSDGTTDASFGTQGRVISNIVMVTYGLLPQPDGKVVFGGSQHMSRLNTDGSVDTSFGNSGDVFFGATVEDHSMVLQPDGKIVVGLYSPGVVARYKANGVLDVP